MVCYSAIINLGWSFYKMPFLNPTQQDMKVLGKGYTAVGRWEAYGAHFFGDFCLKSKAGFVG